MTNKTGNASEAIIFFLIMLGLVGIAHQSDVYLNHKKETQTINATNEHVEWHADVSYSLAISNITIPIGSKLKVAYPTPTINNPNPRIVMGDDRTYEDVYQWNEADQCWIAKVEYCSATGTDTQYPVAIYSCDKPHLIAGYPRCTNQ